MAEYNKFTQREVAYIKENADKKKARTIAEDLGRSVASIRGKAEQIGISFTFGKVKIDKRVKDFILANHESMSFRVMAKKMNIPYLKFCCYCNGLGIFKKHSFVISPEMDKFIRDNHKDTTLLEISEKLGAPYQQIVLYANKIGLGKKKKVQFDESQIAYIKEMYPKCENIKDMAAHLNCTVQFLKLTIADLGVKKQD